VATLVAVAFVVGACSRWFGSTSVTSRETTSDLLTGSLRANLRLGVVSDAECMIWGHVGGIPSSKSDSRCDTNPFATTLSLCGVMC
jgi:hypothetical protein